MAERRMFAKSIVLSDAFLDMPMTARCLYFTLGMLADDDGFVGGAKSIMRQCGASQDDMAILLSKRYVLGFESGVIVIKHWRMNNYLQKDRHKSTTYLEELAQLEIDEKGAYTEVKNGMYTKCIQNVYTGKDSIGKYSKDNICVESESGMKIPSIEDVFDYCKEKHINVDAERFWYFYDSKGWKIGNQPMKNWKSALHTFKNNNSSSSNNVKISTPKYIQNKEVEEKYKDKSNEQIKEEWKQMQEKTKLKEDIKKQQEKMKNEK